MGVGAIPKPVIFPKELIIQMLGFDIAPFALPNCGPGEVRFEEVRDIRKIVVTFTGSPPQNIALSYLQKTWPRTRVEQTRPLTFPAPFGWIPIDDWFNAKWQKAAIQVKENSDHSVTITFQPLTKEFPEYQDYDVAFRRTLGIRIETGKLDQIRNIQVYTQSAGAASTLRVELDAGERTPGKTIQLSGYNALISRVSPESGVAAEGSSLTLSSEGRRVFEVNVTHMQPAHPFCNDDGHITFALEKETFTISLSALEKEGPVWFADQGLYITLADDNTSFADYKAQNKDRKTVSQMVLERPEQSFGGAFHGQPRPHPVAYVLGCKHARQRFWVEPNGDVVLHRSDVAWVPGKDTPRYKNDGNARFFFGLERWGATGRFSDPAPVLSYNIHLKQDDIFLEQKSFAVPLLTSILEGETAGDDPMVALVRFRFRNAGDRPATVRLPVQYSQQSDRSHQRTGGHAGGQDDNQVPLSPRDPLTAKEGQITATWHDQTVLRCTYSTAMKPVEAKDGLVFTQELQPDESCEIVLKIPYLALESPEELAALSKLDFDASYLEVQKFWRQEARKGAQVRTPEPHMNALYALHLPIIMISDFAMPGDPKLVNTSVGTSTYGNYCNESCMIIQELDLRGLHEEVRRRLAVWVKYQGTARLRGNFTDYEGLYFGAGGYESGDSYCQHHGWVLWYLSEHYLLTQDNEWLAGVVDSMLKAADWIFRQRRNTMGQLPHSRGWERGFLPAGALEDVDDYCYWLSTNSLTWRGTESFARALEANGHPEARRIRREADAYARDLRKGFETMRQHTPLVRLRDGRWVPHYPSRLYCRGRDVGWIREVLEGSVYLLISGLYNPNSKEAQWILDDYQDNRYMSPPFGYVLPDPPGNWFDFGGFSIQPNLLAGLMPYLDRDEPELYIWMLFNAWCACYREETDAMVEHPIPCLGYSNAVPFKTSDQSNAVNWLRYMYVYTVRDTLHLGRALPREWLSDGNQIGAEKVATRFGEVSIQYRSQAAAGKVTAIADLSLRHQPGKLLVRIRHPEKLPIQSVRVNGRNHTGYDAVKGDIDITGLKGKVTIEAGY